MRERLILNWISLPAEPPKSDHYILTSLWLFLEAYLILYFVSGCTWCQDGIPCLAILGFSKLSKSQEDP